MAVSAWLGSGDRGVAVERTPLSGPVAELQRVRAAVVGDEGLAEMLRARGAGEGDGHDLSVSYLGDPAGARRLLLGVSPAPEVIVIDADRPGAAELVEELLGESGSDETPLVVVGSWRAAEQAARFVALGVARCLAKPVGAAELRRVCAEVAPEKPAGRAEPLGEVTVEELGARLAGELHRGLCQAAEPGARNKRFDLGDGDEVLTVLWDALARIRELVTAESGGALRFASEVPGGAVPVGSALVRPARRAQSERASRVGELRSVPWEGESLAGWQAIVAEGDLPTNWFVAGVLREAGAEVLDAFGVAEALELCFRSAPDAIVVGTALPDGGGLSLCRALRRDVLLRDRPLVLMAASDAELARVRDLGMAFEGGLLRGATGKLVRQRVAEVLRPRHGLAARLWGAGPVSGRLDELSPVSLLELVARVRPDSCVALQSLGEVFEIELREGRPVRACRTDAAGGVVHGREALAELLPITAGRFRVEEASGAAGGELRGTLMELLAEPVARVRAAQGLLSGAALVKAERVELRAELLQRLGGQTPAPAREVVRLLVAERSPRELVASARVPAELLERVLLDAARRQAVEAVCWADGADRLPEAIEAELACLLGEPGARPLRELDGVRGDAAEQGRSWRGAAFEQGVLSALEVGELSEEDPLPEAEDVAGPEGWFDEPSEAFEAELPLDDADEGDEPVDIDDESFEAPLRADERLAMGVAEVRLPRRVVDHTPILASRLAILRKRPPHTNTPFLASRLVTRDALELARLDEPASEPPPPASEEQPPVADSAPPPKPQPRAESAPPETIAADPPAEAESPEPEDLPAAEELEAEKPVADEAPEASAAETKEPEAPRLPRPSAYLSRSAPPSEPRRSGSRFLVPLAFGVLGVGMAIGVRWLRERPSPQIVPLLPPAIAPVPPPAAQPPPATDPEPSDPDDQAAADATRDKPVELPLSDEERERLGEGKGVIEIVAGKNDEILVDGKSLGRGPVQRIALAADGEEREVRVKLRGEERVQYVTPKEGVRLRLRVAPPWSR